MPSLLLTLAAIHFSASVVTGALAVHNERQMRKYPAFKEYGYEVSETRVVGFARVNEGPITILHQFQTFMLISTAAFMLSWPTMLPTNISAAYGFRHNKFEEMELSEEEEEEEDP